MEGKDDGLQQDQHSLPPPSSGVSGDWLDNFFLWAKKARRCYFLWICACLVTHVTPLQQHNIPHWPPQGRGSKLQHTCWLAPGAVSDQCLKEGVIVILLKFPWKRNSFESTQLIYLELAGTWTPLRPGHPVRLDWHKTKGSENVREVTAVQTA